MRRLLIAAATVPAALLLLLFLSILFIPDNSLRGLVVRGLQNYGYTFHASSFGKTFPFGLKAKNVEICIEQGPVLKANEARINLRLLPLLLGNAEFTAKMLIGGGTVTGNYKHHSGSAFINISNVRLEDIPFFQTFAGSTAKGDLRASAEMKGLPKSPSGDVKLEVRGAELAGMKIGGTPLPDAAYSAVQGKLVVKGGKATLESFTLQGEGLYVRIKGDMPVSSTLSAAPLNVTLELMPKPEFLEKQKFIFLLLTKYLDTPGHYQIPVRGTLGHPSVF